MDVKEVKPQRYAIGTQAIIPHTAGTWRVTCATCEEEGTVYRARYAALSRAVRDSDKPCSKCGAK